MAIRYVLGVDGGGSGCRARLYDRDGRALGEGAGGPANLQLGGRAAEAVLTAARGALSAAGAPPSALSSVAAGLGLAGATPAGRAALEAAALPFAAVDLVSDAHAAALGAHAGDDGGVVILGTGAVAYVLAGGEGREIGGWGFAADDLGSGADIGRRAVRAALRAVDAAPTGARPAGALARAVLATAGDDPAALTDWSMRAAPAAFGALAPLVFASADEGDAAADAILDAATAELARLVGLAERHGAAQVSVLGSIGQRLAPRLDPSAARRLAPPRGDAMDGAARAARHRLGPGGGA